MRKRNNTKLQHTTRAAAASSHAQKAKKNQNAKSKIQPNTKKNKISTQNKTNTVCFNYFTLT
jgi:hypothetical protein